MARDYTQPQAGSAVVGPGDIGTTELADNSVTTAKILNGTILTADIADSQITTAKIANGTILTEDIADSQITTAKIADGTILQGDIANEQIGTGQVTPTVLGALNQNITFSLSSEVGDEITVTMQVKNPAGSNVADYFVVRIWTSDTEAGAVEGTAISFNVTTGVTLNAIAAGHRSCLTDANGTLVVGVTQAALSGSKWLNAEVGGNVYSQELVYT